MQAVERMVEAFAWGWDRGLSLLLDAAVLEADRG
jgi:hypothetical protein